MSENLETSTSTETNLTDSSDTNTPDHRFSEKTFPENILLVEDDPAHAQLISRALKNLSVTVIHKENVEDALHAITETSIDIVITDLNLVTESGFDLIQQVTTKHPELPVLVLTSSSNLNDAVRAMKEGAWDYISKHFSGNFSMHLELVIRKTWERAIEKHRELAAQAERNAFWMAASIADDGLAILDMNGEILYKNQVFDRFLKTVELSYGESNSNNIVSIIAPADFRISQNLFSQIHISNDSLWRSELVIPAKNTKTAGYFDLKLSTIISDFDENSTAPVNGMKYHILWSRDVTKDKLSKEFERTILSSATHDLKGPLAAIITSTELLLEDKLESFIEKAMLRIASCARTSLSLVDQLLSLKRIQDGIMKIYPKTISLTEIAEEMYEEFSPVAKSKNISFICLKPDTELEVYADTLAIKRMIGNLLSNSFKFTQNGGEVTLELESTKSDVSIKVSDNGSGIPPESQGMLFQKYERLAEHTSIEGSGLGLYITKQLVEMHHGFIELKSTPGAGTTFTIVLKKDRFPENEEKTEQSS